MQMAFTGILVLGLVSFLATAVNPSALHLRGWHWPFFCSRVACPLSTPWALLCFPMLGGIWFNRCCHPHRINPSEADLACQTELVLSFPRALLTCPLDILLKEAKAVYAKLQW